VASLLRASREGDQAALAEVSSLLYDELRQRARAFMRRETRGRGFQTTELVHETFVRLAGAEVDWQDQTHFLALASRMMRRVLIDMARARGYRKRGGGAIHIPLDSGVPGETSRSVDLIALDEALQALAAIDARRAQVIELRFFGGLTVEETARILGVSLDTVMRDWRLAKAWLSRALRQSSGG
jgi:RNA polymerase sigma factor (TIGR02999 family)